MANTSVIRNGGKTVALSVTASAHAAVQLTGNTNDQINYVSCLNTGAVSVAVRFSQLSTDAATLPVDGTPGDFLLPAAMQLPIVLACPPINMQNPCYVTAIGAAAGPSLVYFTPAVDQS
jgi:hypothetical protein